MPTAVPASATAHRDRHVRSGSKSAPRLRDLRKVPTVNANGGRAILQRSATGPFRHIATQQIVLRGSSTRWAMWCRIRPPVSIPEDEMITAASLIELSCFESPTLRTRCTFRHSKTDSARPVAPPPDRVRPNIFGKRRGVDGHRTVEINRQLGQAPWSIKTGAAGKSVVEPDLPQKQGLRSRPLGQSPRA